MRRLCGKCRKEMTFFIKNQEWKCKCGFTSKEGDHQTKFEVYWVKKSGDMAGSK